MKRLTILVPDGKINLSSIVGSFKILTRANEYWKQRGKNPVFQIELAGLSKRVDLYNGLFSIQPHRTVMSIKKTDFILIPSLNHDYRHVVGQNAPLVEWIRKQYVNGAEVASICTGAFLIGAAGLLDGKACSTHWAAVETFRTMHPAVRLVPEKIITDERGLYTNGGAFSFLNLILYLVEKYYDRETAIYCSKVFQIDIDRDSQSVFTIFTGQKDHDDPVVQKAQAVIEHNLQERFSFEKLAHDFAVSRRNFDRRFIKATGNTPVEYQQRVKMEAAKRSFETTRKSVNEVMFDVGYNDTKAFRTIFKKVTGLAPLEYRNRYNKKTAQ